MAALDFGLGLGHAMRQSNREPVFSYSTEET